MTTDAHPLDTLPDGQEFDEDELEVMFLAANDRATQAEARIADLTARLDAAEAQIAYLEALIATGRATPVFGGSET